MKKEITAFGKFLTSSIFYRGLVLTLAILIPVLLFLWMGKVQYSIPIAFGVLLIAPNDFPGSLKRKINGILIGIFLMTMVTAIIILAKPYFYLLLFLIGILAFLCSLFAVYGFRGSLLSFSGLFAIVLGLAYNPDIGLIWYQHVFLIGLGGFWYLFLTLLLFSIKPKKDEDELLAEVLDLTGDFLKMRSDLLLFEERREEIQLEIIKLQTQINEKHEILREILLAKRRRSGRSHLDEKRLLIFISLVDILELSLANTLDYKRVDELFGNHKDILELFGKINLVLGDHLKNLSKVFLEKIPLQDKSELLNVLSQADLGIDEYTKKVGLPKARDGALLLRNLLDYQTNQVNEIRVIRRALANVKSSFKVTLKSKEQNQFITHQEYSFSILHENLSLKSPIYRHALRISVTMLIGFLLGEYLGVLNSYWILLTIVVIMRPNYGLTKQRSINRFIGTLLGAIIAAIIIYFTHNIFIYAFVAIFALTFGFSLVQQNYRWAAAFITLHVIFVFTIIERNALEVIQFRILDTTIGALIAMVTNYLLLPNWEYRNIHSQILEVIHKNKNYLATVKNMYQNELIAPSAYKVPRKEAFLAISNMNASFERMTQDPRSKQKEYGLVYEMVTLNNTILAAIASLSSFIQIKKGTGLEQEFKTFIDQIIDILKQAIENFEGFIPNSKTVSNLKTSAEDNLLFHYKTLSEERDLEISHGQLNIKSEMLASLQEVHLLYNQLTWLKNLSQDLNKKTSEYLKLNTA